MAKEQNATSALVAVVTALEPLGDADRQWVLQSAASRWSLILPANTQAGISQQVPNGGAASGASSGEAQSAIEKKDPRAFIRVKRPATDVQRVACLAYFIVTTSGKPGFSSKDVVTTHTDSGGSKINMTRALDNATRRSKYLSNRGPKEKQLTPLGEDIVDALPDQNAVKELDKGGSNKRAGRKAKKKV